MKNLLILDGDLIAYRFAADAETSVELDGAWTVTADLDLAIENFTDHVEQMLSVHKAADYVITITDKRNFRKDLCDTYKANRKSTRPPVIIGEMKKWLAEHPKAKVKPGLEADDVQGIISTNPKLFKGYRKIIVSIDKDMEQVPGWLFNPMRDDKPRKVSQAAADRYFYTQVLTGDTTDGYKGLPGCGPRGAEAILADADDPWAAIVQAYEKKGLSEEDALLQARLARILRHEDYNYKSKEPILWHPNTN